jgi:hypothetical protein
LRIRCARPWRTPRDGRRPSGGRRDKSRGARGVGAVCSRELVARNANARAAGHGTRLAPCPLNCIAEEGTMKHWITTFTVALSMLGLGVAGSAYADCELSCAAECRQEAAICNSTASLENRIGRQLCAADAADALAICESDAIDARADCVGMCGPDLKECGAAAKAALKQCKDTVKIELAGCTNAVATQFAEDKQACGEDAADCASLCVE